MFINPRIAELMLFAPVALIVAIATAIVAPGWITAAPLLSYAHVAVLAAGFTAWLSRYKLRTFCYLLAIFPTMHLAYGFGMILAILRALVRSPGWQDSSHDVSIRVLRGGDLLANHQRKPGH